jgi:hypothetical protein
MTPAPTGQSAGYDPTSAAPQLLIDPQMLFNCADAMQTVNGGPSAQSTSSAATIDYVVTECSTT